MATVSPIENQAPLLRSENDYTSSPDGDAVTPFGHWLDNQANIDDNPTHLEYNEAYDRENVASYDLDQPDDDSIAGEPIDESSRPRQSMLPAQEPSRRPPGNRTADASQADRAENVNANKVDTAHRGNSERGNTAISSNAGRQNAQATETDATRASTRSQLKNAAKSRTEVTKPHLNHVMARSQKSAAQTPKGLKSVAPALSRLQDLNALKQLKTNIKAIFNGLKPLESTASENTSVRQNEQLKGSVRLVSVDNIKPIRLNTLPVEQTKLDSNPKTTLQHLSARKNINLDASSTEATVVRDFKGYPKSDAPSNASNENTNKTGTLKTGRTTGNAPTLRNNILFDTESAIDKRTSRVKGRKKNSRQVNKNFNLFSQPEGPQHLSGNGRQINTGTDAIKENSWLQGSANANIRQESTESDGTSAESRQNSLFAKSNSAAQASEAKQAGKSGPAYATRSLAWLKSLSNRTSFMNRNDPNWKVLEMRLDNGDGKMIVKVLREDDAVSVSVQFSDDNLRAQAETQTTQILESLREQYGKEVSFSFAEQEDSAYEALSKGDTPRKNRVKKQVDEPGQSASIRHFDPLSPDQHIWIG